MPWKRVSNLFWSNLKHSLGAVFCFTYKINYWSRQRVWGAEYMVLDRLLIALFTLNNLPRCRSISCICRQQISCKIKHIAFRNLSTYSLPFHVLWRCLFIFVLECHSKYSCYKTNPYVIKSQYFASCIMHKKYRHQFWRLTFGIV